MEKHLFILSHLQEKFHHNDILYEEDEYSLLERRFIQSQ